MNLYSLFEKSNDKARLDELPKWLTDKAKGLLGKDDKKSSEPNYVDVEQEKQAAQVRAAGGKFAQTTQGKEQSTGCEPGDDDCIRKLQHPHHRGDDDQPIVNPEQKKESSFPDYMNPFDKHLMHHFKRASWVPAAAVIVNVALGPGRNWIETYPESAFSAIYRAARYTAIDWLENTIPTNKNSHAIIAEDGTQYYIPNTEVSRELFNKVVEKVGPARRYWEEEGMYESIDSMTEADVSDTDKLTATIADEAYKNHPELFKEYGDEYVMSAIDEVAAQYINSDVSIDEMLYALVEKLDSNDEITEGAATVFSDAVGHHLKNADGTVVQSFPKTAEGLRAARNALYANFNSLSVETPKESVMKEYEEQFNAALNESMTVNTTASTDNPDTVNVTATDEDAHTLVAILKAAGLPYKEHEAKIIAATPCGEQVEEEYANEPNEVTMSTDFMVNKLAGGLNRAKSQYKKEYPGDNPMAVNEENLMRGLWDLYKKV